MKTTPARRLLDTLQGLDELLLVDVPVGMNRDYALYAVECWRIREALEQSLAVLQQRLAAGQKFAVRNISHLPLEKPVCIGPSGLVGTIQETLLVEAVAGYERGESEVPNPLLFEGVGVRIRFPHLKALSISR